MAADDRLCFQCNQPAPVAARFCPNCHAPMPPRPVEEPTIAMRPRRLSPVAIAVPAFILTLLVGLAFVFRERPQEPVELPPPAPEVAPHARPRPFRPAPIPPPKPREPRVQAPAPAPAPAAAPTATPEPTPEPRPRLVRYLQRRQVIPNGYGSLEERVLEQDARDMPPPDSVRVPDDTPLHGWRPPMAPGTGQR